MNPRTDPSDPSHAQSDGRSTYEVSLARLRPQLVREREEREIAEVRARYQADGGQHIIARDLDRRHEALWIQYRPTLHALSNPQIPANVRGSGNWMPAPPAPFIELMPNINPTPFGAPRDEVYETFGNVACQAPYPTQWCNFEQAAASHVPYHFSRQILPTLPLPPAQRMFSHTRSTVERRQSSAYRPPSYPQQPPSWPPPPPPPPTPLPEMPKIKRPSPQPNPAYIKQAQSQPAPLGYKRPLLVILDLNGTLLHRPSKERPAEFVPRENATKFLGYLLKSHHVMVWSSAIKRNVKRMTDTLLSDFSDQLRRSVVEIWGREKLRLSPEDEMRDVQVYKQLDWVWEDQGMTKKGADVGEWWNETNTLILDDSALKAASHPFNLVEVPTFRGGYESFRNGSVLGQVGAYILEASGHANVSTFVRDKGFVMDSGWNSIFMPGAEETVEWRGC